VTNSILKSGPSGGQRQRLLENARQCLAQQRLPEAAKAYAAVLDLDPGCVEAFAQLGHLLFHFKLYAESLKYVQKAVQLAPASPKLNLLMAAVLRKLGRLDESAECCLRETKISPTDADAHYNLGLARQSLHRPHEALESYQQAVKLRPDYVDAIMGMVMVLRQIGDDPAALKWLERVLILAPANAEAHWEAATILLAQGQFERGWQEYEWRWKLKERSVPVPHFEQPLWDGKDLGGRRILLHCEQGFGDVIQFSRYAALVAERHGEVILGCAEALRPIMETIPGVTTVVTSRQDHPPFDVHAPLMSLPAIFGTTLATVPRQIPYVRMPAAKSAWSPVVKDLSGLKVGLAWAAESASANSHIRSMSLDYFKPLLKLPGFDWYSLQVGKAAGEMATPELVGQITDLGRHFADFGDTARAMAELDLVISVDTCVAHLAGALGKWVWTLLPFEVDWRWMIGRSDSPWYPTMRLFRQPARGDWASVVSQIQAALPEIGK
jgi:Tfp pilus assembly protein PilF